LSAFHERNLINDNAVMFTVTNNLTELEMHAVALYLGDLHSSAERN
jgi:hypothetical protein